MTARRRRGGYSWGPVPGARLVALSLGLGVQSTTLALMAAHGEIEPMPHVALVADTEDESQGTYETLRWLSSGNVLPFPIQVVSAGRLSASIEARARGDGARFVTAPFFTSGGGMGRRQCTREFKIAPLTKRQRELLGFRPRQRIPRGSCELWIGISTDELYRATPATDSWAVNRYPLLERRMSRDDCEAWLRKHEYPVPPKSSCVFCPYKTNAEWRSLRDHDPAGWARALEIDALIRQTPGMREREFLHPDRVPLGIVDLSTAEDRGQGRFAFVCEGHCGT